MLHSTSLQTVCPTTLQERTEAVSMHSIPAFVMQLPAELLLTILSGSAAWCHLHEASRHEQSEQLEDKGQHRCKTAGHGIVAAQVSLLTSSILYCRVSEPCLGKGPVHHYLPA